MSSNPYNDHAGIFGPGSTDDTHRYSGTAPVIRVPDNLTGPAPSSGGRGTTTWQIGEFEAHMERLSRVHESVLSTNQKTIDAVQNTGDAYGMLFGWAIMPFLNKVADGTVDFTEKLADAVENSRVAMRMTMAAYNDREAANAAATHQITAETTGSTR